MASNVLNSSCTIGYDLALFGVGIAILVIFQFLFFFGRTSTEGLLVDQSSDHTANDRAGPINLRAGQTNEIFRSEDAAEKIHEQCGRLTQWWAHWFATTAGPNERAGFKLPPVYLPCRNDEQREMPTVNAMYFFLLLFCLRDVNQSTDSGTTLYKLPFPLFHKFHVAKALDNNSP